MSDANTKETLLVQSKVREEIRKNELRVSDDFLVALNEEVHALIAKAIGRAQANNRKTLGRADV